MEAGYLRAPLKWVLCPSSRLPLGFPGDECSIASSRHSVNSQFFVGDNWRNEMDVLGFVFGMSGFAFAIIGMTCGVNASSKVDKLEAKLSDAGLLAKDVESVD